MSFNFYNFKLRISFSVVGSKNNSADDCFDSGCFNNVIASSFKNKGMPFHKRCDLKVENDKKNTYHLDV